MTYNPGYLHRFIPGMNSTRKIMNLPNRFHKITRTQRLLLELGYLYEYTRESLAN